MTIAYLDTCFLNCDFVFCDSQNDWQNEMNRLNISGCDDLTKCNDARTWMIKDKNIGMCVIAVCIDPRVYKYKKHQIIGLLAHECLHAIDFIMQNIEEERAGDEIRAYLMQKLMSFCVENSKLFNSKK